MKNTKAVYIIHGGDADQHLGNLISICERLKESNRLVDFNVVSANDINESYFSVLRNEDMGVILLSNAIEVKKRFVEESLLNVKARPLKIALIEILIDSIDFDQRFLVLPTNKTSIRSHKQMDVAWTIIERYFEDLLPIVEEPEVTSSKWLKYRPHITGILSLIAVFFFLLIIAPEVPKNVTFENFSAKFGFNGKTKKWLSTYSDQKQKLVDFYKSNETEKGKEFTEFAVETLVDEGYVDIEEAYIETEIADKVVIMSGEKYFVPEHIVLSKVDMVRVRFGITASDNENANNEVFRVLIDGIRYALKLANGNLNDNERIKSLYIMATTNGKHGPHSNHYHGSAIDISRINDTKMVLMEEGSQQIIQLQNAFDTYAHVRENFGPALKHKYTIENKKWDYDFKVKGHVDHIHFSVRN